MRKSNISKFPKVRVEVNLVALYPTKNEKEEFIMVCDRLDSGLPNAKTDLRDLAAALGSLAPAGTFSTLESFRKIEVLGLLNQILEKAKTDEIQVGDYLISRRRNLEDGKGQLCLKKGDIDLVKYTVQKTPQGLIKQLDKQFLIRYAPSCQILEFCQKRPQVEATCNYGTVEDATEDLPCSSFEGAQIAQMFNVPPHLRLQGRREATVSNYRQLVKQVQGILSSHHAQSRIDKPLESKLQLGDGSITLGQLLTPSWRVPNLVDVFLSCCETNLGLTQVTDDLLTIASGFLCAGARSVVSTLWAVDDLATALFSIFYHQYRHRGSCRPAALQQAQEELRSLTGETLATVYQPQINMLLDEKFQQLDRARKEAKANRDRCPKDTPDYLKWDEEYKQHFQAGDRIRKTKNWLKAMSQEAFPFSHPFYWSAFTCSGLR
ncbi:MAG TPA: hypothetical protein DDW76_03280 [Cyanobacteria bacterium UBA11369]|nr:hypothetical protein [Cyanobacteria bacterium UBA11371]HBE34012.1 hypothetical protein [Cyanobacteria bacterium UBA11368]HBE47842.1 hypothetical protein [Cyanobacteria bacterium UBA11369]